MIEDRLFALALDYKKTKLWKKLWDSELFAVTLSNGEIGYCCVMGKGGDYTALALYIGKGMNGYWTIRSAKFNQDPSALRDGFFSQDCLQCSFDNKEDMMEESLAQARDYAKRKGFTFRGQRAFPQFTAYRPYCLPWPVQTPEDQDLLCQALSAALEVAHRLEGEKKEKLGFLPLRDLGSNRVPLLTSVNGVWNWTTTALPGPAPEQYPKPAPLDDLYVARLKKLRKRGDLQCEVIRLPEPVVDVEGEAPCFPAMLFSYDRDNDCILPCMPVMRYEEEPKALLESFCQELENRKALPKTIYVRDERTETLLRGLCTRLKLQLVRQQLLPDLDEIEDEFFNRYDETLEGGVPEDMMEEMFDLLMEMDEETLSTMPAPVRDQLGWMLEDGVLPDPLAGKIARFLGVPEKKYAEDDDGVILFPGWKGES